MWDDSGVVSGTANEVTALRAFPTCRYGLMVEYLPCKEEIGVRFPVAASVVTDGGRVGKPAPSVKK